jgi:DNA ligase-associated metallophosphoesterase
MPLLARPSGPKPRRPRKSAMTALPPLAIVGATVEAKLSGVRIAALPEGALWIEEHKALVVSDLHLEKGSSYALRGQMLPPYDTHAVLMRLTDLMLRLSPEIIVSLGDSFHDSGGIARMDPRDRTLLNVLMSRCDWVWVEGNHDGKAPETLGGAVRDVLHLGSLVLRHEPTGGAAPGEIAGHLHPAAKVAGRGGAVRKRCFALSHDRLVMPAFGAFTGGLNLCDAAFAPIFPDGAVALVLGRDKVLPAPAERLIPD